MGMHRLVAVTTVAVLASSITVGGLKAQEFVAGTTPDRRPEGAPRITAVGHDSAWRSRALAGVSKPVPKSLGFLDDQGKWFTPFDHPNMPPPYDIRGFYARVGGKAAAN